MILLDALRGRSTPRRPLWIMRQAGRYLPEYRALRQTHRFEDLAGSPELAAEVTMLPLRRFPLDAAIIFADLMSPIPALGVKVRFDPGPVIDQPIRTAAQVDALNTEPDAATIAPEVIAALRLVKGQLNAETALLGFAGSPWSLAAYLVQGGGDSGFAALRALAAGDRGLVNALLTKLTSLAARYLHAQVAAGADAVQIFDTWAGLLSLADWQEIVQPHLELLLQLTADLGVPRIMFVHAASHLVAAYAALPAEAIAVDWREDLPALRRALGSRPTIQGNLDPAVLLAGPEATRFAAAMLLTRMPAKGHIVNLGHGILPETPLESVQALVDTVHAEVTQ
ncbi:MAG: uroporphyrinogen decarboxylase [Gemmatimonadales bacterium]